MKDIKVVKFKNLHHENNNKENINSENNFIEQNKIQILDIDKKMKQNYTEDVLQKKEKKEEQEEDQYMKNNTKLRDIVENAIFSQLSEININFKYSGDNPDIKPIYGKEIGSHLPKIYNIELTLLSQNDSISEFKKYGYGIYQFFYYLKILLITFVIIFFFAVVYIYNIFFNFYRKYEEEYTLLYDSNLLLVISGTQIIRFRDFFIEIYGKNAFLEKFEYFDVFYVEYFFLSFYFLAQLLYLILLK